MFLNLLDNNQRSQFLRAAVFLAEVDGVDERELALIERARLECGLPKEAMETGSSLEQVVESLSKIDTVAARNAMALELAGVLVADETNSAEEAAAFEAITRALGVGERQATRALELASAWQKVADDSTDFLSEG